MATDAPPRRHCATSEVHRLLLNTDPEYARARSEIEDLTDAETARGFAAAAPKVRTIPTVVHVVYKTAAQNISDAQVKSQIKILNEDFRKTNADASSVPAVFKPLARGLQHPVQARDEGHLRQRVDRHHADEDHQVVVQLQRRGQVETRPAAPTRGRRGAT